MQLQVGGRIPCNEVLIPKIYAVEWLRFEGPCEESLCGQKRHGVGAAFLPAGLPLPSVTFSLAPCLSSMSSTPMSLVYLSLPQLLGENQQFILLFLII